MYTNYSNNDIIAEINDRIVERCDHMIGRHNKVYAIRMDVRFPSEYRHDGNSKQISELIKLLKEHHTYYKIELHYVWAREQVSSHNPHYHFIIFVDGTHIQNPYGIFARAKDVWSRILGVNGDGLIDHCNHDHNGMPSPNGIMIRRPSSVATGQELFIQQQEFQSNREYALSRGLYLAKTHSKGLAPHKSKEYGFSQISFV